MDEETGELQRVEDQRASQMTIDHGAEKEPAPRQRRSTTKAADHTDPTPHEDRPKRNSKKAEGNMADGLFSVSDLIQKINQSIKDNLTDGAPLDETLEIFDLQLAEIRQHAPDEYEAMVEEYRAIAAESEGGE